MTKNTIPDKHLVAALTFLTSVLLAGVGLVILSGISPPPPPLFSSIPLFYDRPGIATWAAVFCLSLAFWVSAFAVRRLTPGADMTLLLSSFLLAVIGFILLLRLSPALAVSTGKAGYARLVWQQYTYIILSLGVMGAAMCCLTPGVMARLARRVYIYALLGAILIVVTGVFGREINDRRLWLQIGPLTFQTVELVKILTVLFAAGYFAERRAFMTSESNGMGTRFSHPHVVGPFAVALLFILLPIVFQGDLGPALLLSLIMLAMYMAVGGSIIMAALSLVCMFFAGWMAYYFNWPTIVTTRFDMWIDPFHYSEVLSRARWAIASGGLLGTGLGEGMAARIPVIQSDLIFIVICEEMGFVGAISVIGLYLVMIWRGFAVALSQKNAYAMLIAAGLTSLMGIQALIIICGNIGLLPLTGITLPFVSHGGSSMIVSFAIIGVLVKLSNEALRENKTGV